jgi:hypothetical protein
MTSVYNGHEIIIFDASGQVSTSNGSVACYMAHLLGKAIRANLFFIITLALVWVAPDFAQSLKCLKVGFFAPNHVH